MTDEGRMDASKAAVEKTVPGTPGTADVGGWEAYRGRTPGPYVPGTSWRTWWRLFSNFLVLRKVTDEKDKRLIFLQEVGNSNYELLESLLQGRELEDVDLNELRAAMEKHYQPKRLLLAERFGLMSKVQKSGQALHEFYAELQRAANGCSFEKIKDHRDAIVTMVFIGGLSSIETRKRLLEREELTSKEALEQAEAYERVGANAPHLKEGPVQLGVSQVRRKGEKNRQGPSIPRNSEGNRKKPGKGPARGKMKCGVCGALGHFGYECFKRERAYCKLCQKKGHFPVTCRRQGKFGRKDSRQIHWCVEPPGSSDSEEEMVSTGVNAVQLKDHRQTHCRRANGTKPVRQPYGRKADDVTLEGQSNGRKKEKLTPYEGPPCLTQERACRGMGTNPRVTVVGRKDHRRGELAALNEEEETDNAIDELSVEPPRMLRVETNGRMIPFELDTGASMSIIDEKTWHMLGQPELRKTDVAATAYNNKRINFQGKVEVEVKFAGKTARLDLHVFRNATHSLCGRDMIRALQIDCGPHYQNVHHVNELSKVELKKQIVRLRCR